MKITRDNLPYCICGAWADPESYGGDWDKSSDWCYKHGWKRQRVLRQARTLVKRGEMTQEEYEQYRDQGVR